MPFDFNTFGTGETKKPDATIPAEKTGSFDFSTFGGGETAVKRAPKEKKPGVVQTIAQTVAQPFLKTIASGGALLEAGTGLAKAIVGKEGKVNQENYDKIQKEGIDFGYLGKAKPIGAGFDATKGIKENVRPIADAAGVGLEIASYIVPVGKAKTAIDAARKGKVLKGAVEGAKAGSSAGAIGGTGMGLQEEDASVGSVIKNTAIGGIAGGILGGGLGAGSGALRNTVTKAVEARSPQAVSKKVDDLVGTIIQGEKKDIPKARKAFAEVGTDDILLSDEASKAFDEGRIADIPQAEQDLARIKKDGIKTYDDLSKVLDHRISKTSEKLSDVLSTDRKVRKLKDLVMETKVGDQKVRHNYVEDALDHLEELYTKTTAPADALRIKQLKARAKQTGLTIDEVNKLAIEHGTEFKNKAFSKASGEPLTSVNAQSFENVRTGLKGTARDLFDNPIYKEADSALTNLINARGLARDMAEKVNALQQKIVRKGFGQKLGALVARLSDLVSGGTLKGIVNYFIPRGEGLKVLNALDLEKMLAGNLKKIQALIDSDLPEKTMIEKLEEFMNLRGAPVINLENPSKSRLPKTPPKLNKK